MPLVLVVQPIAEEGIDFLKNEGLEVRQLDSCNQENILLHVEEADAILVRHAHINRQILEAAKNLKVISRHGAGLDSIDVKAATEKGIQVTYTPQANYVSVTEHVIGMMMVLAKNMRKLDIELRGGNFESRHVHYGVELEGKTLSIVGLGTIGRALAKKAVLGLGMRVIGYDPFVKTIGLEPAVEVTGDWSKVFKEADFVSLNLSLTDKTKGLVGKKEFEMMNSTAYFINCSRGQVVVEEELIDALKNGLIAGAGLDVYEEDPPSADNPLFSMENTIVTPHTAAHTHEAMRKMATQAAQGIIEVLKNKPITWPANSLKKR